MKRKEIQAKINCKIYQVIDKLQIVPKTYRIVEESIEIKSRMKGSKDELLNNQIYYLVNDIIGEIIDEVFFNDLE